MAGVKKVGKLHIGHQRAHGTRHALALRQAGLVERVVGIGRRPEPLAAARELGIIDEAATGWADALAGAELVLLAMPVGQMDAVAAAIAPHLEAGTIVTDAGSTKRDVIEAIYRHLGHRLPNVVPAHPIAGAEKSGPAAAQSGLYRGRKVVVTPLPENRPAAVARVREVWSACGAVLHEMSPQEHDRVFAAVSHLPHLLSFALVHDLAVRDNSELFFTFAGPGFRDFTRIAGSHPEMWRDIALANRDALLIELKRYEDQIDEMRAALEANDGKRLEEIFDTARTARRAWAEGKL